MKEVVKEWRQVLKRHGRGHGRGPLLHSHDPVLGFKLMFFSQLLIDDS